MESRFRKLDQNVLDDLKVIVGPKGWKSSSQSARYLDDPRGRFCGKASRVLLPDSTKQLSEIVKKCCAAGVGIIPYGGGTGVVAGQLSIESENAIIVSTERMNSVRKICVDDGVMVAEAGCILENIHSKAEEHGFIYPLSMASKGSCCIGGILATNAGGIQVVRYGNARDLCLGVEVVLPDGSIYSDLTPLRKNNTGYDLRHLMIGSEGTLGIITAATLALKPIDPEATTVLCAIGSPSDALEIYKSARQKLGNSISALELMSGFGVELVTDHFPTLTNPFPENHDWYLLMEASGPEGINDQLENVLGDCVEGGFVLDAVVAQSQSQRSNLWDLRENTPEANRAGGAFCNSDTSVAVSKVGAFIQGTTDRIKSIDPRLRINSYGHIGDGNIHHNVLPPLGQSKSEFIEANPGIIETVRMAINETTRLHEGSISAEHGIGRLKVKDLERFSDPAKLEVLQRIKKAIDPKGIMNPGAILR